MTNTRDVTYHSDGSGCTWEELLDACAEGRRCTVVDPAPVDFTATGSLWYSDAQRAWVIGQEVVLASCYSITIHDVPEPHWSDDEPMAVAVDGSYLLRQPDGTYAKGPTARRWTTEQIDASRWSLPILVIDRHGRWGG